MKREMDRERPPPLRVNREGGRSQNQRPPMVVQTRGLQYRQPLIIHTFSPEIIQTNANDFMQLVQRLTGQASHISPLAKRPRHVSHMHMHHASEQPPLYDLTGSSVLQQEQQRNMAELGLQRGRTGLQISPSPRNRVQGGMPLLSPGSFEFSPSMLPSPTTFLCDFPSLLSPNAAGLPSPRLARVGGSARSPVMTLPAAGFPSPGPLTSAFLADLPALSPAAYKWIEKHPHSAESLLSSLPRGFGLPPRPPPAHG